jgi:ubiquinone/menaquinone biosynthesis C-methylase UbiE
MLRLLLAKLKNKLNVPKPFDSAAINAIGSSNGNNRDQWIIKQLQSLSSGIDLLDAGAGEQPYKKYCSHLNYVSQDFAQYKPEALKEGLQMNEWEYGKLDIISDVTSIPRPDHSFDAVLCTEVIEHIINPLEAIKEFSRLLKPGGQLILTAPFCSMTHFAPYHFYSGYNRFFYQSVLPMHGFEIVEMQENGNYFEYLGQELKRMESMGNNYSKVFQSKEVKQSLDVLLEYLYQCSSKDEGSKELMYWGMHVRAVKVDGSKI